MSHTMPQDIQTEGLRPVNLRTDLGQLADLIELVFADNMDASGQAAVREMRTLSRMSIGLGLLSNISEIAAGMNMGYVWIADGRVVGNISIYPMKPAHLNTWIIANVGVHPDYQRRGIAGQLLAASMQSIRQRGGMHAVLQVEEGNDVAQRLYQRYGFVPERNWILWRRAGGIRMPAAVDLNGVRVSPRRGSEWAAEYALAQQVRPAHRGGLGWLRPLHQDLFRRSWQARLGDWLNMRLADRFVIRDGEQIVASLWAESGFMTNSVQLTLMVQPEYLGMYDTLLLNLATRRFDMGRTALMIEHPADELTVSRTLREYQYRPQGHFVHMRWDV